MTEVFRDYSFQPAHREPVVDGFLRTDMDVLALGPWVVRKEGIPAGAGERERREGADVG